MKKQPFSHSDTLIIIFAREPIPGQVKTRLIPVLGEDGAAMLYQRLLDYTINTVIAADLFSINLCITPESRIAYFAHMASSKHFDISIQEGKELGIRMYNAIASALKNYSKVILIGTDCPFLSRDDLQQAIISLDSNDMVFSPAKDGGYVLVGANKIRPEIFQRIDWGTHMVMAQTRTILLKYNVSWQELSEQYDIDVKDDLKYLLLHDELKSFIETSF